MRPSDSGTTPSFAGPSPLSGRLWISSVSGGGRGAEVKGLGSWMISTDSKIEAVSRSQFRSKLWTLAGGRMENVVVLTR